MRVRIVQFGSRNRATTIALAALALVVGGALLAFGVVLLLSLAVVTTAVGAALLLRRSIRRALGGSPAERLPGSDTNDSRPLDPALRVFPPADDSSAGGLPRPRR